MIEREREEESGGIESVEWMGVDYILAGDRKRVGVYRSGDGRLAREVECREGSEIVSMGGLQGGSLLGVVSARLDE